MPSRFTDLDYLMNLVARRYDMATVIMRMPPEGWVAGFISQNHPEPRVPGPPDDKPKATVWAALADAALNAPCHREELIALINEGAGVTPSPANPTKESRLMDKQAAIFDDGHRRVYPVGETTEGGANAEFVVEDYDGNQLERVTFQSAPIPEVGPQGVTNEALLAMVFCRLSQFQQGSHPCDENQRAVGHVREAWQALDERTENRKARGVEGRDAD